jgi:putative ABC transport system permease protein
MSSFFRKLRWLARRPEKEAELREELRLHLEEETAQRRKEGLAEDRARWAARRELGNVALIEENTRVAWGWTRLEQFARDAVYGLRQVQRNPAFSAIAVATLALGIGGITAMFSAVDTVLIRRLPYADADRLVIVWDESRKSGDNPKLGPTPAEWLEWRRLNSVFTDIAATQPAAATLSGDSEPEQVPARKTTGNLWSVLGIKPLIGRAFTEEEDWKAVRVAVISYGLWQRRYGGSPEVLGRKITINDNPYEVIGVMPRDFYFLPARDIDIWMPASYPAWMLQSFGWHDEQVVARLKPAMTLEGAQQSMAALSLQLTAAKDATGAHSVIVMPLREALTGKTQRALVLLLCASAALLLIACVNLANLLLSRSAARSREVAVRVAIGAGRGRLVAQLLTESLILAGLGTVAGLALATPAMQFLEVLVPETMGAARLTLDWRILAFSACAALAATLTFGLAPALRGSQLDPQDALRSGGRGMAGARHHWFQHSLIIIETALAVVLLTSGGLLMQTIQHLRNTDLGLRSEKLLTFETPLFRYRDFNQRLAFLNAVLEKIRATPGAVNASATNQFPLTVNNTHATFYLIAGQSSERSHDQVALMRLVTRDYLQTIGAKLREGRFFDSSDRRSESPVAIVNETFANRNFPGRSAMGARFQYGRINEKGYWYTIVGVVKEIREVGMTEDSRPAVYLVLEQTDQVGVALPSCIVVRTSVEPSSIVSTIRQAIWSVDKNQPISHVQTLDAMLDNQLSTPSQSTMLMSAFALLALLLASLGLYGVLSYAVTQRTNEIGVRMALGATSGEILLSFGKRGLALTLAGLAVGLILAAIAVRSLNSLLYGFRPDYVPAVTVVSLILLAVAALACFVPARRASRVDPVIALRNE